MGELEKLRGHDCETKSFKRLAFPDPVQRREHPVSCSSIRGYGGADSLDGTIAREYPRKGKVNKNCIWNGLQPDAGNRRNAGKNRKTKMLAFQWLTDLTVPE